MLIASRKKTLLGWGVSRIVSRTKVSKGQKKPSLVDCIAKDDEAASAGPHMPIEDEIPSRSCIKT